MSIFGSVQGKDALLFTVTDGFTRQSFKEAFIIFYLNWLQSMGKWRAKQRRR
jgi:hypothetical protein